MRYGPVYCSFLDREYSTSVGFNQPYDKIRRFLYASLLASDSYAYCSLSAIGECRGLAEFPHPFLTTLLSEKLLVTVSDYNDPDLFLLSRRYLYRDDASRYPLYFEAPDRQTLGLWEPRYVKTSSSTGYLVRMLPGQFNRHDRSFGEYYARLEDIVRQVLASREDRAITIALFTPALHASSLQSELDYRLRSTISYLYTLQFLTLFSGVLMNQLPYFEVRDRRFPTFRGPSYRIWRHMIPRQWIANSPQQDMASLSELLEARSNSDLSQIRTHLKHIDELASADPNGYSYRHAAETSVASITKLATQDNVPRFFEIVRSQLDARLGEHPDYGTPRLIITCATSTEETILRAALAEDRGFAPQLVLAGDTTYWDLGRIGDVESFLVRTGPGSMGGAAALATLQDAIRILSPSVVVSCGICFGLRPKTQRSGTVVFATRIRSYEQVRIGTRNSGSVELRERGQAADVDPILSLRARGVFSARGNIAFGEVISGEKLVDHINFRDQLLRRFPDALAGEMEGGGLVAACSRRRVPWVLLKAISDFGDGQKKVNEHRVQRRAARAAAEALVMLVNGGGFSNI